MSEIKELKAVKKSVKKEVKKEVKKTAAKAAPKKVAKKEVKKAVAKKAAKKSVKKSVSQSEILLRHIFPDIEIIEGNPFTEGVPDKINVSLSYKMNTGNYENISFQSSITINLKKGADVGLAIDQAYDFVAAKISEKALEVKNKKRGNQSE